MKNFDEPYPLCPECRSGDRGNRHSVPFMPLRTMAAQKLHCIDAAAPLEVRVCHICGLSYEDVTHAVSIFDALM